MEVALKLWWFRWKFWWLISVSQSSCRRHPQRIVRYVCSDYTVAIIVFPWRITTERRHSSIRSPGIFAVAFTLTAEGWIRVIFVHDFGRFHVLSVEFPRECLEHASVASFKKGWAVKHDRCAFIVFFELRNVAKLRLVKFKSLARFNYIVHCILVIY